MATVQATSAAPATKPGTPITTAIFVLDDGEGLVLRFPELSGMTSEVLGDELRSATKTGVTSKVVPVGRKPPTVVLRRALTNTPDHKLWSWHQQASDGSPTALRTCSLAVSTSGGGEPIPLYQLVGAWPAKIEVIGMKAGSTEIVLESVTFMAGEIRPV